MIETFLLLAVNHQSLIATKANRVVRAAEGRTVLEFGSRRAQGSDAAILGARAAYIGGCHGTACTISDQLYGVRAGGTMAHAWVQMFDSELEAFQTYCRLYPTNATLLVDTYDTPALRGPKRHSGVRRRPEALGHHQIAASAWIPETWPISPEKPGRCWTRRAGPNARSRYPILWTNT